MPGDEGQLTPEQLAKGEQVTEYYRNLPADSEPSPPEPVFKDLLKSKEPLEDEVVDDKKD